MNSKFSKILKFLNLTDFRGNLSITNIAVIIMVTKLAFLQSFSLTEVSAFLIAMLSYSHKRYESARAENKVNRTSTELFKKVEELQNKVSAIDLKTGLRR